MAKDKPKRQAFASEGDWLSAAATWLERRWPDDQRARIDAWQRMDAKTQRSDARRRMGELIAARTLTNAEERELDGLIDEYMAEKRRNRAATDPNERKAP